MTESQPSRIAFLEQRVATAQADPARTTFDVPFRQRTISLVKIQVPIGFPLFNVLSGRTHKAQAAWIDEHDKPSDFFDDAEDEDVQVAQAAILRAMISLEGLDDDLARRDQQKPIILTYDGFVIDGNRRVAALREEGTTENVMAVVLPEDALVEEVFGTELELQMARDTRADYDWIDQALHVRYGVQKLREDVAAVARRMNKQEREVNDVLARLVLVDLFLQWAGTPDAYHRVPDDSEQSFIELADREGRAQFRSLTPQHKEAVRLACFGVIQSASGGYMDIRHVADTIRSQPENVVARVREQLPAEMAERLDDPVAVPSASDDEADIISQLAEAAAADDGAVPGAELLNVVRDPGNARVSAPVIISVANDLVEESRELKSHLEPLRKLERALQLVRAIHPTSETHRLATLAERAADLAAEVDRLADEIGVASSEDE